MLKQKKQCINQNGYFNIDHTAYRWHCGFAGCIDEYCSLSSIPLACCPYVGPENFCFRVSSVFMFVGLLTLVAGLATNSIFISAVGTYVALVYLVHFLRVTRQSSQRI